MKYSEYRISSHVTSLISPRTTTYEDVLLVNWSWPQWPRYPPADHRDTLHSPDPRCLYTNTLYLGQTSALLWTRRHHQLDQHSVEGMCNDSLLFGPPYFSSPRLHEEENWGLLQNWTFPLYEQDHGRLNRHFSVFCWFLKQNSIFFPHVFNDSQNWTRNRTYCRDSTWYTCRDEDCSSAYTVLTIFIFVFFPFVVFQNRLPLEDRLLNWGIYTCHKTYPTTFPFSYTQLLVILKIHNVPYTRNISFAPKTAADTRVNSQRDV